jgi:hypothetical protein
MADASKPLSQKEIAAAIEQYPGMPLPMAIARYMLDKRWQGQQLSQLRKGMGWGGIHLETIGLLVQKIAEAVYHLNKKSVTIRLEATNFPLDFDHWWVEIQQVEAGRPEDREPSALAGWPCSCCEATIREDDYDAVVVMLKKLAKWQFPTYGHLLNGSSGRALGAKCGACVKANIEAISAIKKDGDKFVRVPLSELEDLP